jgi:hypothetical protein
MGFSKIVRLFAAFFCGVGSIFLLMKLDAWFGALPSTLDFLAGSGVFVLAGAVGCVLTPRTPFSAAAVVVFGVFIGISLHVSIYPTINGYERNLYPLEIAANSMCELPSVFRLPTGRFHAATLA